MSSLSIFHFDALEVRAVTIDGNPWFVASDVCAALGHSNPSKAVSDHVDDDDKSNHSLGLPGKQPLVVNESGLYALIFGSQLESAKRFKKWVTSEVLPSIRSTGGYIAPQASSAPGIEQDLRVVGILADLLRVAPSGRITMAQVVLQQSAPHLLSVLPSYAIDAPAQANAPQSSEPTASLTALLRQRGSSRSAASVNMLFQHMGILEQQTRQSTKGEVKRYWAITGDGLKWGKNVTSPTNPRETQPHWYKSTFGELLRMALRADGVAA